MLLLPVSVILLDSREVLELVLMLLYQTLLVVRDRVVSLVLGDRDQDFLCLLLIYLVHYILFFLASLALELLRDTIGMDECIRFLVFDLFEVRLERRLKFFIH